MSICNELGWACEVIQKDYGEDLWIQTTIGDEVDHCRIWFQVKATESISTYERKEGQLVFRVDTNHALRWARNLELVVFVLWDVKNDVGYWTLPQDNVTDLDLLKTRKKTARLFLNKANQFTKVTAGKLSWLARIDHYETLMAVAQQRIIQNERESKIGMQDPLNTQARMNLLCYDFLRAIGFFDQNGRIDTSVGRKLISEMELILLDRPNSDNASLCSKRIECCP